MEMVFHSNARSDMEVKAHNRIKELMVQAKEMGFILPKDRGFKFSVNFDLNSVRNAGSAFISPDEKRMTIKLHRKALEHYKEEYIERTVIHEFVHILQYCQYGFVDHKNSFKMLMRKFGANSGRCHSFDLRSLTGKPKRKSKPTFKYSCGCETVHEVSALIHKRINIGQSYHCKDCKQNIKEI